MAVVSKRWCFTLNNPTFEEMADFHLLCQERDKVRYAVLGDEVGEQGTPHIQGYVVFCNNKTLGGLKKLLVRAHWEKARGSSPEASAYCKKDGRFVEYGDCPLDNRDTRFTSEGVSRMNANVWQETLDLAKSGEFVSIRPDIYIRHRNAIHAIYEDSCTAVECIASLEHIWLFGATGIGKSKYCWETFPGAYRKPLNKWWDHYVVQEVVIIEDVDPSHEKWLGHLLKIWADHYPFIAERKGGSRQIRPKKIVVTSNYLIRDVFKEEGIYLPLERRFSEKTLVDGVLL